MSTVSSHDSQSDLIALEASAASARAGFACMFSTSDEYENALITARRAEGRYGSAFDWQPVMLGGCALALLGVLVTFI
ncbi:hypothetical protein [Afipia birgiae]|jgi:hypothetical protein|uniref:hypothetical protein n=1 Tax=Afipia birgiae TaxID=151414 RepID=UPI0002DF0286|nr:hypothetical protein [Afipia birgiae]MBX9821633.1 hypothetical protein [Afipia birgiae]